MCHLMKNDVVEALRGLLGKLEVEPDPIVVGLTGPPFGLHSADGPVRVSKPENTRPRVNKRRNGALELPTVPLNEPSFSGIAIGAMGHVQLKPVISFERDPPALPTVLNNAKSELPPPDVVGLAVHHLPGRLTVLSTQFGPLTADPRQSRDHCQAHCLVVDRRRRSDSDTAERWIDTEVEVLDVFTDDFYVEASDVDDNVTSTHLDALPGQTARLSQC